MVHQPKNNLRFVSSTGYLPVTKEAFGEIMSKEIEIISDQKIKKLLQTSKVMQKEYEFYIPPLFDGVDELQEEYKDKFIETASQSRKSYLAQLKSSDAKTAYEAVSKGVYEDFMKNFVKQ